MTFYRTVYNRSGITNKVSDGVIKVYKNDILIGTVTSSMLYGQQFGFEIGQTMKMEAVPGAGYAFNKYCIDYPTNSKCSTVNPATETFTSTSSASGYRNYYFMASVTFARHIYSKGNGSVNVYKNNTLVDTVKQSDTYGKDFTFAVGDIMKMEAVPDAGYVIDKYCLSTAADAVCSTTNPDTETFTLTSSASGYRFYYFKVAYPYNRTIKVVQGLGRVKVYKNDVFVDTATPTHDVTVGLNSGDSYAREAFPDAGYNFIKFCTSTDNSCYTQSYAKTVVTSGSSVTLSYYFSQECNSAPQVAIGVA